MGEKHPYDQEGVEELVDTLTELHTRRINRLNDQLQRQRTQNQTLARTLEIKQHNLTQQNQRIIQLVERVKALEGELKTSAGGDQWQHLATELARSRNRISELSQNLEETTTRLLETEISCGESIAQTRDLQDNLDEILDRSTRLDRKLRSSLLTVADREQRLASLAQAHEKLQLLHQEELGRAESLAACLQEARKAQTAALLSAADAAYRNESLERQLVQSRREAAQIPVLASRLEEHDRQRSGYEQQRRQDAQAIEDQARRIAHLEDLLAEAGYQEKSQAAARAQEDIGQALADLCRRHLAPSPHQTDQDSWRRQRQTLVDALRQNRNEYEELAQENLKLVETLALHRAEQADTPSSSVAVQGRDAESRRKLETLTREIDAMAAVHRRLQQEVSRLETLRQRQTTRKNEDSVMEKTLETVCTDPLKPQ